MAPLADYEREVYRNILEVSASEAAREILKYGGEIFDTRDHHDHQESSIDVYAAECVLDAIGKNCDRKSMNYPGGFYLESKEIPAKNPECTLIICADEIDGTINTKRSKASLFFTKPIATVSLALFEGDNLGSITASAVYDIKNDNVLSSLLSGNGYRSYCNKKLIMPDEHEDVKGDSKHRVILATYSNKAVDREAAIKKSLIKEGMGVYGGHRSSSFDVLSMLYNGYDAYVDQRALYPNSGSMLQTYDIAGVLPIAKGCGFEVTDTLGNSLDSRKLRSGPVDVIIARKSVGKKVRDSVKRCSI